MSPTTPANAGAGSVPRRDLRRLGLEPGLVHWNDDIPALGEHVIRRGEGIPAAYDGQAGRLARMFAANVTSFAAGVPAAVRTAEPVAA